MTLLNIGKIEYILLVLVIWALIVAYSSYKVFLWVRSAKSRSLVSRLKNFRALPYTARITIDLLLLAVLGVGLTIILLRPVSGTAETEASTTNLDIAFIVDISLSMSVEDFQGSNESRLEGTKHFLSEFVRTRNDRFALISFSHEAHIELPLTFDRQTIITGINTLQLVDSYRAHGTSLASAFEEANKRLLSQNDPLSAGRQKVIILVSDGEQTAKAQENLSAAIAETTDNGIRVFTLGAGTQQGGKIIDYVSMDGEVYYVKRGGEFIISKLNEKNLKDIANTGKGTYIHLTSDTNSQEINNELENLALVSPLPTPETIYNELYYYITPFLMIAFLVYHFKLYNPVLVLHRKQSVKSKTTIRSIHPVILLLFFPLFILLFNIYVTLGNNQYAKKDFASAEQYYLDASGLGIDKSGTAYHNLGNTYYRQGKYEEAIDAYTDAINETETVANNDYKAQYYYNQGNAYYRDGENHLNDDVEKTITQWENAIVSYENCLDIDPDDTECKENLEFVKKRLEQLRQQQQQKKGNEKPKPAPEPEPDNDPVEEEEIQKIKKQEEEGRGEFNKRKKYWRDKDDPYREWDEPYW